MALVLYWGRKWNLSVTWFDKREIAGIVAFCGFDVVLVVLLVLKTLDIACSPRGTVWRRVNIRHSYVNVDKLEDVNQPPGRLKYTAGALFGRRPWQEKLP
jgi:hypothetical protein